jgi:excisionase family DNA binding protein
MESTAVLSHPLAMRLAEAAKSLGISPRLLWQLTRDGHIPCVRVGGSKRRTILYPTELLREWLAKNAGIGASDAS